MTILFFLTADLIQAQSLPTTLDTTGVTAISIDGISNLGDIDGDGAEGFIAGIRQTSPPTDNFAVLSGRTGTIIHGIADSMPVFTIAPIGQVDAIADINGDGINDYVGRLIGFFSGPNPSYKVRSGLDDSSLFSISFEGSAAETPIVSSDTSNGLELLFGP